MKKLLLGVILFAGLGVGFAKNVEKKTENLFLAENFTPNKITKTYKFSSEQEALKFLKFCHEVNTWFSVETEYGIDGSIHEVLYWNVEIITYLC